MESHSNVKLEMSSLRVMVKRSRGKKQQEETEKQQHFIVTESNLFKGFNTEDIRKYDQEESGNLDIAYIIPHPMEDSWLRDSQRCLPSLSILPKYFWS